MTGPQKRSIGSGITERSYVTYGPGDGPLPAEMFGTDGTATGRLERLRDHCVEVLRFHRLPDDLRPVRWTGPDQWNELDDATRELWRRLWDHQLDDEGWQNLELWLASDECAKGQVMHVGMAADDDHYILSDSPGGYAARALAMVEYTAPMLEKISLQVPDEFFEVQNLAISLLSIGHLCVEAEMKGLWEVFALKGRKVSEAARQGHQLVHGTDSEKRRRWHAMKVDWAQERAGGQSCKAADSIVAERHGVSTKTVYRARSRK